VKTIWNEVYSAQDRKQQEDIWSETTEKWWMRRFVWFAQGRSRGGIVQRMTDDGNRCILDSIEEKGTLIWTKVEDDCVKSNLQNWCHSRCFR